MPEINTTDIWKAADRILNDGRKAVIAVIIEKQGSAPRESGTKCLVLEDGSLIGTIGGGRLEYEIIQKAEAVFETGEALVLSFDLVGGDVAESDMICGGRTTVLMAPLLPEDAQTRAVVGTVCDLSSKGGRAVYGMLAPEGEGERRFDFTMTLFKEDGTIFGNRPEGDLAESVFGPEGILKKETAPRLVRFAPGGQRYYLERIARRPMLYIFGAGHVSKALHALASMVGYRVHVIDDRAEFADESRFPEADVITVSPFSEAFDRLTLTENDYVVIVTRGHLYDHEVLGRTLEYEPAYIGMIGSRSKREKIYNALEREGIAKERLERIHSPIGLDIGAKTPEEIAVSIVAELIQVRSER